MQRKPVKTDAVHVRLTKAEHAAIMGKAKAHGMTLCEWARRRLVDTEDSLPSERRLMAFIAAQTVAIRVGMEEWQKGKDLSNVDVQERIERLAVEASRAFTAQGKKTGEAA